MCIRDSGKCACAGDYQVGPSICARHVLNKIVQPNACRLTVLPGLLSFKTVSLAALLPNGDFVQTSSDPHLTRHQGDEPIELAVTGTASILIPLPQAIDDHQTRNAEVLAASGAAVLLAQQEATPERVADLLEAWIESPLSVATMSRAALGLSRADATDRVVTVMKEIAHASI